VKLAQSRALTLEAVVEHFEAWRREKKKGERIPDDLWSEAIALLSDYSVSEVVKTLRLCGADLRKRQATFSASKSLQRPRSEMPFVELDRTLMGEAEPLRQTVKPVLIELERADGSRVRIRQALSSAETLALVERFMRA
jgi:hypothetical protein